MSVPAESANLRLSFNVAAFNQVSVSARICSFYGNPFASRTYRCCLQVSVSAATYSFPFAAADQVCAAAARNSCRRARAPAF
ncbi:hypothetical protein [Methanimicrococcus hongohii]|uniref:hypothetical protein n=1 Tax=Methanimicrococcus hongohii TaxID=3028295 RepID=UPI00293143EC|nr:hypothetical protein [Methanimicrococcus sp. Hf6]